MKYWFLALLPVVPCVFGCAGKTSDVGSSSKETVAPPPNATTSPPTASGIVLGDRTYALPDCGFGTGGDSTWLGPLQSLASPPAGSSDCPWPKDKPAIDLSVLLTDFLQSAGFSPGTYDLADPNVTKLRVELVVSTQTEVPDENVPVMAVYSSAATPESGGATPASGVSGTVTVGRYQDTPSGPVYDVTLNDVVLPIRPADSHNDGSFPSSAKINSAHLHLDTSASP